LGDAVSISVGLFVSTTSRSSTACLDLYIAKRALIAYGQFLKEYKMGNVTSLNSPWLCQLLK
ncbi:MAG: hypothetical protein ACI88A_004749, partial [Paraglaciecola sp.]